MFVLLNPMLIFLIVSVTEENDLVTSMVQFKNKLGDFFHINPESDLRQFIEKAKDIRDQFEARRQKLKKAFKNIMGGGSCDKETKKMSQLRMGDIPEDAKSMSAIQLIAFHGYLAQSHSVHTRDGYVLDIHRIISGFPKSVRGKKILALLHHGLMGSSEDWLLLGPGRALPYLLSDAGYDVWLTNARGNKYSRFDNDYVFDPSKFWDFSFHEMGHFDLAAVIDYIQNKNKNDLEINFVGHSMGGTALLVLLSTLARYNQVLHSATLLAPLAFMFQIQGPFKLLAEFYKAKGRDSLNFLGENKFMSKQNFSNQFIEKFCERDKKLCTNPLLFLSNGGKIDLGKDILEKLLGRIPAETSTKTIVHYLQLVNSGNFKDFDYGASDNLKRHGVLTAPSYDLGKVTLPINLFSSHGDWLCTASNMQTLFNKLPNVALHHIVKKTDFSHTDFVWGENVSTLVYIHVLNILENRDYTEAKETNPPQISLY